jgi:hypothetical protein
VDTSVKKRLGVAVERIPELQRQRLKRLLWKILRVPRDAAVPDTYDNEIGYPTLPQQLGGYIVYVPGLFVPGGAGVEEHLPVVEVQHRVLAFGGVAFGQPMSTWRGVR